MQIRLEPQNYGQWLMKTAIKRENDEFLVISPKHVMGLPDHAHLLGTQKLLEITHENAHKYENDEFLVISLKHIRVLTRHANLPGAPKLWAIAHENGHKT